MATEPAGNAGSGIMATLTKKVGPFPVWVYVAGGGVVFAILGPKLFANFGGNKTPTTPNGATPANPNGLPDSIDPLTGVPYSVENAIDPNTGLPYWATLFGPGSSQGTSGGVPTGPVPPSQPVPPPPPPPPPNPPAPPPPPNPPNPPPPPAQPVPPDQTVTGTINQPGGQRSGVNASTPGVGPIQPGPPIPGSPGPPTGAPGWPYDGRAAIPAQRYGRR